MKGTASLGEMGEATQGLLDAEWRASANNRRARYYALSREGRKRLREEAATWRRYARAVEGVLEGA